MMVDTASVFLSLAGVFLLYLFCKVFLKPLGWLFRLFLSCVVGGAGLWAANFLLGALGWHLAINPLNCMIAGVLGIPGVVLARILSLIL